MLAIIRDFPLKGLDNSSHSRFSPMHTHTHTKCCEGGLGEAVAGALSEETGVKVHRLAVTGIPRSGPGSVLMDMYGISAKHIKNAVKAMLP